MAQIQSTTLVQMILNAVNDLKDLTHPKGFPPPHNLITSYPQSL